MESEVSSPAFTVIAPYYDQLMSFVDYPSWVSYIGTVLALSNVKEKMILDLACGTGVCLQLWLEKGYQIIGLDKSLSMLEICKKKLLRAYLTENSSFQLINGDMRNFALAKRMPIITCLYDSLNYLLSEAELLDCFQRVYENLEENGLFIFDMNTTHSLRDEWGNQTYRRQDEEIHSIWTNSYNPQTNTSTLELALNIRKDGEEINLKEFHQERAYPLLTIAEFLSQIGFRVSLYRHLTFTLAQESDLRIMGVAIKS